MVFQLVRNVSQEGAAGFDFCDLLDRLLQAEVRRMRFVTERVQHQATDLLNPAESAFRKETRVGDVSEVPYLEAEYFQVPVKNGQRFHPDIVQIKRSFDEAGFHPRRPIIGSFIEDVRERLSYVLESFGVSVNGNRTFLKVIEWPDVVQAQDVIGVPVRIEYAIQPRYWMAHQLDPEIGTGVDDPLLPACLQKHRGPSAPVPRVG